MYDYRTELDFLSGSATSVNYFFELFFFASQVIITGSCLEHYMKLHFIAIEFIVILQHEIIFSNETSECIIPHDILGHGGLPHVNNYKSCYLSSLVDLGKGFFPFNALLMRS